MSLKPRFFIDIETISPCDLPSRGAKVYAEDTHTKIMVLSILDNVDRVMHSFVHPQYQSESYVLPDKKIIEDLVSGKFQWVAHYAIFEYNVLSKRLKSFLSDIGIEITFPKAWANNFHKSMLCTQQLAALWGFGSGYRSLEAVSKVLTPWAKKSGEGKALMKKVCNITKLADIEDALKKWSTIPFALKICKKTIRKESYFWVVGSEIGTHMTEYCETDVEACFAVFEELATKLNDDPYLETHLEIINLTNEVNKQGINVNFSILDELKEAVKKLEEYREVFIKKYKFSPDQKELLKEYINKQVKNEKIDVELESVASKEWAAFVEKIKEKGASEKLIEHINFLSAMKGKAYKKVSLLDNLQHKGRLHDFLMPYGSITGRWSSSGVQMLNMPKSYDEIGIQEAKDRLVTFGEINEDSYATFQKNISKIIRGCFCAPEKKNLFIVDLEQIEARLALYKGGEKEALARVASGICIYSELACEIFKMDECKKGDYQRDVAKISHLLFQYQGGLRALGPLLESFLSPDKIKELDLPSLLAGFVMKYPNLKKTWNKFDRILESTLAQGRDELKLKLDTGRFLTFSHLKKVEMEVINYQTGKPQTRVFIVSDPPFMKYRTLRGGFIFQNGIQAIARDYIFIKVRDFLRRLKKAGLVLIVHDEGIFEVPEKYTLEELMTIWNESGLEEIEKIWPGFPDASDGKLSKIYCK